MELVTKKVLDTSLPYLLENVSMTPGFYAALTQAAIFTDEVMSRIRSYRTDEESITQLISQLKRRKNDSFRLFLNALCSTGQDHVADYLNEQLQEFTNSDELDSHPPMYNSAHEKYMRLTAKELIDRLVKQEHEYENLRRLNERMLDDFQATLDENKLLQDEVDLLRRANEIEGILNTRQSDEARNARVLRENIYELEEQLVECQAQLEAIKSQFEETESKLQKMKEKRRRLATTLNVAENASAEQILAKIEQLKLSDFANQGNLERMQSDLLQLQKNMDAINQQKSSLVKKNQFLEQQMRTLRLQKRRLDDPPNRNLPSRLGIFTGRKPTAYGPNISFDDHNTAKISRVDIGLPQLGNRAPKPVGHLQRSGTEVGLILPPIQANVVEARYCIICRQEFHGGSGASTDRYGTKSVLRDSTNCRVHYRAYRNGSFQCCGDKVSHGAGCVVVKHLYVDVRRERNKTFYEITDGSKMY